MNADTFQLICSLVTAIAGVIPTIVSVVLLVRNIIKNKDWQQVCEIAKAAMTAAEDYAKEHPEMSGEQKLDFALEIIKKGLNAAGIKFDEALIKQIIDYINQLCSWTKTVNSK